MYFTRDPVIETVITSREGYKLSIRNSKHLSQDPFVVEAIEVICLGGTSFFRNCDHCKPFLVPAADYEITEVRDAKINLKAVGLDRGVKIVGGRDALLKMPKVSPSVPVQEEGSTSPEEEVVAEPAVAAPSAVPPDNPSHVSGPQSHNPLFLPDASCPNRTVAATIPPYAFDSSSL